MKTNEQRGKMSNEDTECPINSVVDLVFGEDAPAVKSNSTISKGDIVILYSGLNSISWICVQPGKKFKSLKGLFLHSDMIGKKWGTKFKAKQGDGHIYLLKPTPELWSKVVLHRTQVIYNADAAFISGMLEIRSGTVVVELGTGSGCFTYFLARAVGNNGKIYTFERDLERYTHVNNNMIKHGLQNIVRSFHKDVCQDGIPLKNVADCIFVDIQSPWKVIQHIPETLKRHKVTRVCVFCTCSEQIALTCAELKKNSFFHIKVHEVSLREFCVKKVKVKDFKFYTDFHVYTSHSEPAHNKYKLSHSDCRYKLSHSDHKSNAIHVDSDTSDTDQSENTNSIYVTHNPKIVHPYTAYLAFANYCHSALDLLSQE